MGYKVHSDHILEHHTLIPHQPSLQPCSSPASSCSCIVPSLHGLNPRSCWQGGTQLVNPSIVCETSPSTSIPAAQTHFTVSAQGAAERVALAKSQLSSFPCSVASPSSTVSTFLQSLQPPLPSSVGKKTASSKEEFHLLARTRHLWDLSPSSQSSGTTKATSLLRPCRNFRTDVWRSIPAVAGLNRNAKSSSPSAIVQELQDSCRQEIPHAAAGLCRNSETSLSKAFLQWLLEIPDSSYPEETTCAAYLKC